MQHSILYVLAWLWMLPVFGQDASLRIRVQAPPQTPVGDSILVIGNQAVWGFWIYPKSTALKPLGNGLWEGVFTFPVNTELEFKLTRGSYYKEALYNHTGHPAVSSKLKLVKDTSVFLQPSQWNDLYQRSIIGTVRYHHQMGSVYLKQTRNVVVWLPASYASNKTKRYPVLYAHDGQNLFDHTNLSGNEWRMDEVADSLMRKGAIEEFIIVGIANTKDRWIEYNGTVEGKNYLHFLVEELKPFIDQQYRTKADRANTAIIGSSMGGLISLYALYTYPQVFSKGACLSSAFYFDDGDLMAQIKANRSPLRQSAVYLDCGGKDLDYDFLPSNREMKTLLEQDKNIRFQYEEFPEDPHNELAWSRRLFLPYTFLFAKNDANM